jgi:hypothetical protein
MKTKHDKNWKANKDVDHCGITNADRVERAAAALSAYSEMRGTDESLEDDCADLMADLMHFAASEGFGAEKLHQRAEFNFQSER